MYKIEHIPISNIFVNPDNPRVIKDAAFKRLVKSLADCPSLFEARPLICSNRTGKFIILGGNMRFMAAKDLEYTQVPVILMPELTEEQEREIAIKDNGDFGEWDFDALANFWSELPLADWGVNLPEEWLVNSGKDESGGIVPPKDPNILVRLSFHPGLWLGKREEIQKIFEQMEKTYSCTVKIDE